MAKLTDKQRKQIVADFVETQNKSAVARKHEVSWTTVDNVVKSDASTLKLLEQKKEENTQDIIDYLNSQTEQLKRFGIYLLEERLNPETNKSALDSEKLRDLIQAYGVLMDKQLKAKEIQAKSDGMHREIEDIAAIRSAVFGSDTNHNT